VTLLQSYPVYVSIEYACLCVSVVRCVETSAMSVLRGVSIPLRWPT